jgi:hypothetical protein
MRGRMGRNGGTGFQHSTKMGKILPLAFIGLLLSEFACPKQL